MPKRTGYSAPQRRAVGRDHALTALATLAVLLATACGSGSGDPGTHTVDKTRVVERAGTDLGLHTSSTDRLGVSMPPAATKARAERSPLAWDTPKGWVELAPTSMRAANFRVAGDERAECYLTVLGGDGGGLAANVNRWRAQMSQAPAAAADIEALPRAPFFGRDATFLDVTGTWTGMSGKETDKDYELLGLLVVDPAGSIFLKMVGPRAVIAGEVESFKALARSFRRNDDPHAGDPHAGDPHADAPRSGDSASATSGAPRAAGATASGDSAAGLSWVAPDGWRRAPDRATRAVSFYVGPDDDVECYVTVLGGDAGGPLANVNRWRKQLERPDLTSAEFDALERIPLLGGQGLLVEITGNAQGAEAMMLGALGSMSDRAVFVKLMGPKAKVEPQRARFHSFAMSLRESK